MKNKDMENKLCDEEIVAKKKKKRRMVDNIITSVLVIVIIVCIVGIVSILGRYRKADRVYSDIQDKYLLPLGPADTFESNKDAASPNTQPEFKVDFDALLEYNSDIVGWIYSDNTPISYPVAQAADNSYYVRRSLDRQYLITGTIFADFRCGKIGDNANYVIYGHHMRNGTIFGSLEKYVTQEYYEEHPTFLYYTPEKNYVIDIFAGYVTDINSQFFKPDFNEGEREKLLKEAKEKSGFVSNIEVSDSDSIMTFVTCSYKFTDARFVLIGKIREK